MPNNRQIPAPRWPITNLDRLPIDTPEFPTMIRDALPLALAAAALAVALERPRTAPVVAPYGPTAPVVAPWPPPAPTALQALPQWPPCDTRPGPIRRTITAAIDAADRILPYR